MPDCKENKQTDAGSSLFSKAFSVRSVVCKCSSSEREVYLHMYNGNVQQRTLHAQHPVTTNLNTSPRFSPTIFYRDSNSVPTSTPLYSSINRLYAQNPGFEIVREESMKVYLHTHNGNVQQNPLCVESCVANGFSISPRLSPTMFDPDANSVLLRAHLFTAV